MGCCWFGRLQRGRSSSPEPDAGISPPLVLTPDDPDEDRRVKSTGPIPDLAGMAGRPDHERC